MLARRDESARQLAGLAPLPAHRPVVVLTHGVPTGIYGPGTDDIAARTEPAWQAMDETWRQRATAQLMVVSGSAHLIASTEPNRVVDAILHLVRDARDRVGRHD